VLALDDVSLQVAAGAVHAVVGENGAGKSTLMKILAGAISADAGIVEIDGRAVRITDARSAQRHGIAIVYQDFALVGDLSVSENVFLGRWPHSRRTGCIDFASLHRRAAELLSGLGIPLPVRRRAGDLSVAQQQMVEIAKALSFEARILILDEPSAALTPHELEALFRLVRGLKDRGVSVIYISHRLDEIFDVADTVTVLRDGRHISTRPIEAVQRSRLIAEMVGREMKDEFPSRACPLGEVVLAVDALGCAGRFANVSFNVRSGEVLALTGLVGSGRTSVGKTIFGAVRATDGKVMIGGQAHRLRSPREAIAAGIAMLPEDRKLEGLLLERNLRENTTLANRQAVASTGFLRIARERALTRRLMTDLQIKAVSTECIVATLSGGNQQKVLLARWMSRPHRVIIFDEPTRGVDVGAKYEIYTLINRLAADGMAVVMISSELPEVIGMADRIGIMHEGRLVSILDNGTRRVTQEQILRLAAGQEHVS
jgi:ribose transport system ATP-binding protein